MKLESVLGKTGYIETVDAAIPFYRLSEHRVVLFDSGTEPDEALLELLEQHDLRVRAVVCTHLHPDHIANNEALVVRHGTEIFAHPLEFPWLYARQNVPYPITEIKNERLLEIDGAKIRLQRTPGHTDGHLLCVTPDNVCCLGDALMTQDMLDRSKIPYMEDVDRSIISMEAIRRSDYPIYIAAHRGVITGAELPAVVDQNIQKELDLYELLRRRITEPMDLEQVTDDFIRASGVRSQKMLEQDFVRHTARVRIFALVHAGEFSMEENMIIPKRF